MNNTSQKTKLVPVGTSIGKNITATMASVSLILISIAAMSNETYRKGINAQIKSEGEKMKEFGIDTEKLQLLVDSFEPGKTPVLSKMEAGKTAYQFIAYEKVVNGVNVLAYFTPFVPTQFKPVFGLSVNLPLLFAIDQLNVQNVLISAVLGNESYSSVVQKFATTMSSQTNKIVSRYPLAATDFGLKTITMVGLKEFTDSLLRDCSDWTRTQVSDAAIEQKTVIAKTIGCTEANVEKWAVEYKKTAKDFNTTGHPTITDVNESMTRKGVTPAFILSLSHVSRQVIAVSENTATS